MSKKKWVVLIAVAVLMILAACTTPAPSTSPTPTPAATTTTTTTTPAQSKTIIIGTGGGPQSTLYVATSAICEPLRKAVGIEMKPHALGTGIAPITGLKEGMCDFVEEAGPTVYNCFYGTGVYKEAGWKPMNELRAVWALWTSKVGFLVGGNSDIHTVKDIKGKTIAWVPTDTVSVASSKGIVAFAGVDWDDVKKVVAPDFPGHIPLVKDGAADFCAANTANPNAYELGASPRGLRWLQMPREDKEAWARFREYNPVYGPTFIEEGKGAGIPTGGLWGFGSTVSIYTDASKDPAFVYNLVRGLTLSYQGFKDLHPMLYMANTINNANPEVFVAGIPLHEGTVRWLKEIGCWTPEWAKEQENRLKAIGASY